MRGARWEVLLHSLEQGSWNAFETPNYILKVSLHPSRIQNPSISRTLSCPPYASFQVFHQALQISFGWASNHLFRFTLELPASSQHRHPQTTCLDFSRQPNGEPVRIIDDEEEEFDLEPEFSSTLSVKGSKIRIGTVLGNERYRGTVLEYEHDFRVGWEHEIVVPGQRPQRRSFASQGKAIALWRV